MIFFFHFSTFISKTQSLTSFVCLKFNSSPTVMSAWARFDLIMDPLSACAFYKKAVHHKQTVENKSTKVNVFLVLSCDYYWSSFIKPHARKSFPGRQKYALAFTSILKRALTTKWTNLCSCLIITFQTSERIKIEIKTIVKTRARPMPCPFITLITFGWILCCWLLKDWIYFCLWLMSGTTFRHCSNNKPSRWIFWLLFHFNSSVNEVLSRVRCLLLERMVAITACNKASHYVFMFTSGYYAYTILEVNFEQKQKKE